MAMEGCGAQPANTADDRPDPRALSAAENSTQQGARSGPDGGVFDAFPSSATGFDRAFDVDFFTGRRMVKLHNFSVDLRPATIGHDQAIETKHHAGASSDLPRYIDLRNVTVHARVPIIALIDDSCTEWIRNLRIGAGNCVIEADPECRVYGHDELSR